MAKEAKAANNKDAKRVLATITKEDLAWLKKLHQAVDGIKGMIGDVEIAKQRLLGDYNKAVSEEGDFVNQLYAKYGITQSSEVNIDMATGEVTAPEEQDR